jgi:methylmalonyl-CoA decarboxylase
MLIDINHFPQFSELVLRNESMRNALTSDLLTELTAAFEIVENNGARVIVLRAINGNAIWSSGFNIEELPLPGIDPVPYNHPLEQLLRRMQEVKIPIIAMMEGSVWGGACDLAFSCDLLVGTPKTTFALTPSKIGVPYNSMGILRILSRMQPNIAKEMFFTAAPLSAERAYQIGLLNYLVDQETLESFVHSLANQIAANSPLSISAIKKQIDAITKSKPVSIDTLFLIDELRQRSYQSEDYLEGINAFKQKRKPDFKGN